MATVGTTSRPAYVYDQETDTWVPVGVGPHTHDNFVTATTIDAKGDLLAGSAPDTVGRLPIGANGTLLVADSTETLGMAWRNNINVNSSTDAFRITQTGAGNAFVVEDDTNPDSTPFIITSSGNVGIGTSSPTYNLDIATSTAQIRAVSTTGTNLTRLNISNTGGSFQFGIDNSVGGNFGFGGYSRVLWNDGAYPLVLTTNSTERMRIDSNGNVGIGTSTLAGSLTVKGNSASNTGQVSILKYSGTAASPTESLDWPEPILNLRGFGNYTSESMLSFGYSNDAKYQTGEAVWNFRLVGLASATTSTSSTNLTLMGPGALVLGAGSSERMRIDNTGSIHIGQVLENIGTSTTALTGTNGHWVSVFKGVAFYTTAATGNWTFDIVYNGTTTLNSVMGTNQSMTLTMLVQQGATPRFTSGLNIDGVAQTVRWQGGLAPANGNANSIDVYTFTIIKTANATYTVLGSQTRFA